MSDETPESRFQIGEMVKLVRDQGTVLKQFPDFGRASIFRDNEFAREGEFVWEGEAPAEPACTAPRERRPPGCNDTLNFRRTPHRHYSLHSLNEPTTPTFAGCNDETFSRTSHIELRCSVEPRP